MNDYEFSLLHIAREAIGLEESRLRRPICFARQAYRVGITERARPLSEVLGLNIYEVSVLLALVSEVSTCSELLRRCANFWQDDLRDVVVLESRLLESIERGELHRFIACSHHHNFQIRHDEKIEIYRVLSKAY